MISTTSAIVRTSVNSTSLTDASMVVVRSTTVSILNEGGTDSMTCGSSART